MRVTINLPHAENLKELMNNSRGAQRGRRVAVALAGWGGKRNRVNVEEKTTREQGRMEGCEVGGGGG